MRLVRTLTVAALALSTLPASAWDDTGHRIVGLIAYNQLSPEKQEKLNSILKLGEPSFAYNNDSPAMWLAAATTFPDFIKRNQSEKYEKEISYYNDWAWPPALRDPKNNEGVRMKCWHYINRPLFTEKFGNQIQSAPFDAVKAVNFINGQYAKESEPRMRAFWIYFMSHIVGDLHQPLHCAASCAEDGRGDAGGNFFKLLGDPSNLHYLWDSGIKDAVSREGWRGGLIEKAAKISEMHPPKEFSAQLDDLNPDHWADEGAKLAETTVYAGIQQGTAESPEYRQKRIDLSLKQAALGGYRLAKILDAWIK
ncbi:MAG: S1/P1 nuclease [Armatimonadetes bacterium]|nr:S1/P1 nuclease [Armatimonadota bacterium]